MKVQYNSVYTVTEDSLPVRSFSDFNYALQHFGLMVKMGFEKMNIVTDLVECVVIDNVVYYPDYVNVTN